MKNIIITVCFFFLCGNAFSEELASGEDYWNFPVYEAFLANNHAFQGLYTYSGDKQGDFKNDYVAILSDGSHWKVHPKNKTNVESWLPEDPILVHARQTPHWFKREHNLELHNVRLKESVPVMLIKYPEHSLTVVESTLYVANVNDTPTFLNLNGKVFKTRNWIPYSKGHEPWYPAYRIKLLLSDGSSWWQHAKSASLGEYKVGAPVYISSNKGKVKGRHGTFVFCISGLERQSNWQGVFLVDTNL